MAASHSDASAAQGETPSMVEVVQSLSTALSRFSASSGPKAREPAIFTGDRSKFNIWKKDALLWIAEVPHLPADRIARRLMVIALMA